MINRKRFLCMVLACMVTPFNVNVFAASNTSILNPPPSVQQLQQKNVVLSKGENTKGENTLFNSSLSEQEAQSIQAYFLDQIDKAFKNLVFLPESNYLILPLCDGRWATNAFCNPEVVKQPDFARGLVMDMMLAICGYHLNTVHSMSPEQRQQNCDSLSVKIVRWLNDDHLPSGSQNSYDFWNLNNAKIFNTCQWNACQKSYNLMEEYLKRFEETKHTSPIHMLDMLYENKDSINKNKKDKSESQEVTNPSPVSAKDVIEITNYFLEQIEKAFDNLVFLPESNYLVLPLCDGHWATNAFCNPEVVEDPNFVRGLVMDMSLAICMYHLNKVHTMSAEARKENCNSISVKIVRWLNDGHLPEGSQTSYNFWDVNNAKIFNTCQWNACQQSYNLMTRYFKEYEKTNGNGSTDYMLDMLYPN